METLRSLLTLQPQHRPVLKALFLCLIVVGTVMALIPLHIPDVGISFTDKIIHATAFFGFAVLLDMATTRNFWRWKVPLLLAYGFGIEVLQHFTPWRSFELMDFAADTFGVLLYWVVAELVRWQFAKPR